MSDDAREPVPVWRRKYPTWALKLLSDRQVESLNPSLLWVKVVQRVDAADHGMRDVARTLYLAAPHKGSTFPLSQRHLADDVGSCREYASGNLDRLAALGFLAVEEGSGPKPNRYTLTLPTENPDHVEDVPEPEEPPVLVASVADHNGEELVASVTGHSGQRGRPLAASEADHTRAGERIEREPRSRTHARESSPDDDAVPPLEAAPDDVSPRPHLTVVTDDGSRPESVDPFEDDATHEQVLKSSKPTRDAIRHALSAETRARELAAEEVRRRQEREDAEEHAPTATDPTGVTA